MPRAFLTSSLAAWLIVVLGCAHPDAPRSPSRSGQSGFGAVATSTDSNIAALLQSAATLVNEGRPAEAQAKLESAERLARDPDQRAAVLLSLSLILITQGRLSTAYAKAEELMRVAVHDSRPRGMGLVIAGISLQALERLDEAEERLKEAAAVADSDIRSLALIGLAAVKTKRVWLGLQAESLPLQWSAYHSNLKDLLFKASPELAPARSLLTQAAALAKDPHFAALARAHLAEQEAYAGHIERARSLARAALLASPGLAGVAHRALGTASILAGEPATAAKEFEDGIKALERAGSRLAPVMTELRLGYAIALLMHALQMPPGPERSQRAREGVQAAKQIVDLFEDTRAAVESVPDRIAAQTSSMLQGLFTLAPIVALAEDRVQGPAVALEIVERGRARGLLDLVGRQGPTRSPPSARRNWPAPKAKAIQQALRGDETLLEFKVFFDATVVWRVRREGVVRAFTVQTGVKELRERVRAFVDTVRGGPHTTFDNRAAHELYNLLLRRSLSGVAPSSHLVIVSDDVLHLLPFELLNTAGDNLRPAYLTRRHPIRYYPSAGALVLARATGAKSGEWKHPLFALAAPLDATGGKASGAEGAPASERMNDFLRSASVQGYRVQPLLEVRREVVEIAKVLGVLPVPPHVLIGAAATKTGLVARSAGEELLHYRFVHLAAHGLIGTDLPGISQPVLLLTGPSPGDTADLLTMGDLAELRLSADLMVLSACQTGRGEQVPGEGVLSLSRAGLLAGARSVIASLWNVSDEATASFMGRLYMYLSRGMGKARALQQTREDFLSGALPTSPENRHADLEHPFFWAPFVLVGDD